MFQTRNASNFNVKCQNLLIKSDKKAKQNSELKQNETNVKKKKKKKTLDSLSAVSACAIMKQIH